MSGENKTTDGATASSDGEIKLQELMQENLVQLDQNKQQKCYINNKNTNNNHKNYSEQNQFNPSYQDNNNSSAN